MRNVHSAFLRRANAFLSIAAAIAFFWACLLSASPQLHQRIHPDANRTDHNCAVTMLSSGNYDHSPQVPLISAPVPAVQFSKIPALTPQWVESPFLSARIFEHAPPARS